MKILLGDFNTKISREFIFIPAVGNESLHKVCNANGIIKVNLANSKNLIVKSTMFSHHNILKFTWIFPVGNIDNILADRSYHLSVLDGQSSGEWTMILITMS
jgi:hypothetical protein